MQIGDHIQVKAYKADRTCYRWWRATVEAIEPGQVVLVTPPGHRVESLNGGWTSQYAIRSFYWSDRWYSLLEVYAADGELAEIYVNVGSPAEFGDAQVTFTDYELDVSRRPPHRAHLEDEDEFREAASRYGYSEAFQRACYRVVSEALALADRWVPGGMPTAETLEGEPDEDMVP